MWQQLVGQLENNARLLIILQIMGCITYNENLTFQTCEEEVIKLVVKNAFR